MNPRSVLIILLCACSLSLSAEPNPNAGSDCIESPKATIALTGFDVNGINLQVSFRITNRSDAEIWVCSDINKFMPGDHDQYLIGETKTLMIRRRQDVPFSGGLHLVPPMARYVRLSPGEKASERVEIHLPARDHIILSGSSSKTEGDGFATRFAVEIGYYVGDLPSTIRAILEEAEKYTGAITQENLSLLEEYFPGVVLNSELGGISGFFGFLNESYLEAGELFIYYPWRTLKGEQVLRLSIDGVDIPYKSN